MKSLEDNKGVIRRRKSQMDRQHKWSKETVHKDNNDLQTITQIEHHEPN